MTGRTVEEVLARVPSNEGLMAEMDANLSNYAGLRAALLEALGEVDTAIASLEAAKREFVKRTTGKKPRVARAKKERTALQRAGSGNLVKALTLLTEAGPLTKAQIASRLSLNNGTTTYALRALEDQGKVRKTGGQTNGSFEYEAVARKRRVSRPGTRR